MDWDAEDAHPWGLGEESGILGYELYQVGPCPEALCFR